MWDVILGAISFRSFSTIWYWLAVAGLWLWAVRRVLGLPQDLLPSARRSAAGLADLAMAARVMARRMLRHGPWVQALRVALAAMVFGLCSALAFVYFIEWAQALWFLLVPILVIAMVNRRTAQSILRAEADDERVATLMRRASVAAQVIAFVFITAAMLFGFAVMLLSGQLG